MNVFTVTYPLPCCDAPVGYLLVTCQGKTPTPVTHWESSERGVMPIGGGCLVVTGGQCYHKGTLWWQKNVIVRWRISCQGAHKSCCSKVFKLFTLGCLRLMVERQKQGRVKKPKQTNRLRACPRDPKIRSFKDLSTFRLLNERVRKCAFKNWPSDQKLPTDFANFEIGTSQSVRIVIV